MPNQRLELTWIGKGEEPAVEPRILLHDADRDYGDPNAENMLIHGDNLLALKALEQEYAGQVKCIYIDPPYNTGAAFEHYDDNLEHSKWLNLLQPRLKLLRELLSEDGTIWISIDNDEQAYLKVLCDEIFGRKNFIENIVWQRAYAPVNLKKTISRSHDYVLVYAKNLTKEYELNKVPRSIEANNRYKNPDNDPRGVWKCTDSTAQAGHGTASQFYVLKAPNGKEHHLTPGRCWVYTEEVMKKMIADNRVWFGEDGNNVPALKRFLTEVRDGIVAQSLWTYQEVGHTQEAKKEVKAFGFDTVFDTPKPERLIERVLTLATNPGDLVLDSFLGSGTTAAVAHKMGRRYIGIELGDHCYTHCKPRLDKVIDGEQGGISKSVNWQGGGGYKFYELAPTLIVKDKYGNPVFSDQYNSEMLVAAVSKINGYRYAPDKEAFWKQGVCQDHSYIFVTTEYFTTALLDGIAQELGELERLLVCAPAFDVGLNQRYENITVRKIPDSVLKKCEYGVDNYNLNIVNPPELDEEEWEDA